MEVSECGLADCCEVCSVAASMSKKIQKQEHLLHQITNRIRQSLDLQEILSTAAHEIRAFLDVDRVKIYRFDPDGSGAVIAESIQANRLPSLLGLHFPANDVPPQTKELFIKARQRVIVDVTAQRKTTSQLDCLETGHPLTIEDIRHAPVEPCHLEYLLKMGVLSSLVIPILYQNQLWGLFAIHHAKPRRFSERELQILQLLVDQVSIAIAQSNLLNQVQQQAQNEAVINQISSLLHCPLNLAEIRQTVLEETVKALAGSGGRLYLAAEPTEEPAQLYTTGTQPIEAFIEESSFWQERFGCQEPLVMTSQTPHEVVTAWEQAGQSLLPLNLSERDSSASNISGLPSPHILADFIHNSSLEPLAAAFQTTTIRSVLVIPLQYRHQYVGWLSIFRDGYDTEILWAGRYDLDERNAEPRRSFEAWRETKLDQSPEWTSDDIKLAQTIGIHLYMATMQKRVEAMLRHEASHDRLTNLPNRLLFNEQLSLALLTAQQQGELLAVAFLDLDRFKTVNDTLGHASGDQLLQQVTQRLQSCLRQCDVASRWGGDEFTLLLPHISYVEDVSKIAQRILDVLSTPFYLESQELYISASLGIALFPYDEDAETLLKNADAAMYRAKQQGRNNFQFYSPEMNTKARERLELEIDLRKALTKDEFLLYYQPQVDIHTGNIVSLEALIRWQHPQLGLIPPNQFIPLAEETGLICFLGEWVIRAACLQHQAWLAAGLPPFRIAVNLSARQFQQQDLVKTITQILQETKTEPCYLELEITESTVMQDVNFTITILQELRDMGIQIAMDDFGTGYSSLNSIKHFPLHTLKIDQSFVRDLMTDPSDAAIAKAVVALGKGLNLQILAEGVETIEQLEFLRALGCDSAQGYFFSKPLPAEEISVFLVESMFSQSTDLQSQPANLATYQPAANQLKPNQQTSTESTSKSTTPNQNLAATDAQLELLIEQVKSLEISVRELGQQVIKQKQVETALRRQVRQEQLLTKIMHKVNQLLQPQEVLDLLVSEARQLLQTDRVVLYRFNPDWTGVVIAASALEPWDSLLNITIEDHCFQEHYLQYYQKGRTRAIDDIYTARLAPCHIELLAQFQVRANLVVPVLQHGKIWGLLIAHHCQAPRQWQQMEINLLYQLASRTALAIERAELHQALAKAKETGTDHCCSHRDP